MRYAKALAQVGGKYHWRYEWLAELVTTCKWEIGAELGLRKGATFLHLLEHCPDLTLIGVDSWAEGLGHQEVDLAERMVRDGAAKYGERAQIIKGWTVPVAAQIADESLDFIFVDADHSYESVRDDLRAWMPKVKKGGWFIGHDINWPSVEKAVAEVLPDYFIGPDNCWARINGDGS
jgi:predicted O-methyltransferase YrrM